MQNKKFIRRLSLRLISIAFLTALSVAADEKPSSDALNKVRKDDVVAVCGDSITAGGYSLLIESYLSMCYKDVPVKTVKFGWPGDSMGSFWGRKCGAEPILSVHPSIVTLCYGMNDGGYKALGKDTARHYRNGMEKLVQELKKNGVRTVIIGSPTAVDTTTYRNKKNNLTASDYNSVLAALGDSAKQLAEEQGSVFVNIHDLMLDVMAKAKAKYGAEYHVAGKEGVHPSGNGNLVIAYAFLKAMGCDGNIGTITVDLSGGKAEASAGHKILSFKDGVVEVESSRYPFCFKGKPDDPSATSGIIEFFPFNEDLNRFKLVVTGQKAGSKIRVTWGQATKEYSSDNLAKGINLAADFIENPFCEPFGKVYWIIVDKKSKWETRQYAYILSRLPVLQEDMKKEIGGLDPGEQNDIKELLAIDPDAGSSLERLKEAVLKKDAALTEAVEKAVVPVRHSIRIEIIK